MKQCIACKEWKVPQNFAKSSTPNATRGICKSCAAKYARAYRKAHPERSRRSGRLQHLKEYGLTPETYNVLVERQAGVCAICKRDQLENARLCIDHNHQTGQVRGLLCRHCNAILGLVEKIGINFTAITSYLENNLSTSARQLEAVSN